MQAPQASPSPAATAAVDAAAQPAESPLGPVAQATPAPPAEEAPPTPPAPSPASAASAPLPPREAATGQATAFAVPGSVRLKFNVTGRARQLNYEGNGELLWLHDGASYEARLEAGAFLLGSRAWTSTGRIGPQGLAPTRYGDKSRSERAAHFDRDKGRISFSANTPDAPLLSGAQDRLSVLLQLASLLAGDPARYAHGATVTVQTVGPREADIWLFTVEGQETIRAATAEYATLKLTRNPRREFDQKVEVWFAPELGYLPVRLRLTEANGDFLDQQLRAVEKP
jgi:hypothetical protein